MEYFVNLIDICKMAAVAVGVIVFCTSVKKERAYSRLDKLGVVLNIVLSVLYVPLSLAGVCMVFFADNPSGLSSMQLSLLYAGIYCGISIPVMSIAGILLSVFARRKGHSIFSFCIQFLPIAVFILALGFCICATIH